LPRGCTRGHVMMSPKQAFSAARGPPSNTPMPGPTSLTSPNKSLICLCTSTQLCNKGPIRFSGMPQLHLQNCPFPFKDNNPYLIVIHPSLDQPHSLPETASGYNQPFCHNTLCRPTDRPTDQQMVQANVPYQQQQIVIAVMVNAAQLRATVGSRRA